MSAALIPHASVQLKNGRYIVKTEPGFYGDQGVPPVAITFEHEPKVLAYWEQDEGNVTCQSWVIGDGEELAVFCRSYGTVSTDPHGDTRVEMDITSIDGVTADDLANYYAYIPGVWDIVEQYRKEARRGNR